MNISRRIQCRKRRILQSQMPNEQSLLVPVFFISSVFRRSENLCCSSKINRRYKTEKHWIRELSFNTLFIIKPDEDHRVSLGFYIKQLNSLWARRLNFFMVKVVMYKRNTLMHKFLTGQKFVGYRVKIALGWNMCALKHLIWPGNSSECIKTTCTVNYMYNIMLFWRKSNTLTFKI